MNLRQYLWDNNLTIVQFSKKINYNPTYIGAIIRGKRIPGKKMAMLIERGTEGQVKADSIAYPMPKNTIAEGCDNEEISCS